MYFRGEHKDGQGTPSAPAVNNGINAPHPFVGDGDGDGNGNGNVRESSIVNLEANFVTDNVALSWLQG